MKKITCDRCNRTLADESSPKLPELKFDVGSNILSLVCSTVDRDGVVGPIPYTCNFNTTGRHHCPDCLWNAFFRAVMHHQTKRLAAQTMADRPETKIKAPPSTGDRIIIGESQQAGFPISAPVHNYDDVDSPVLNTIRWVMTEHVFVLQQFREWYESDTGTYVRGWVDVDCSTTENSISKATNGRE